MVSSLPGNGNELPLYRTSRMKILRFEVGLEIKEK